MIGGHCSTVRSGVLPKIARPKKGARSGPAEAFSYYRANGVPRVVVEQKHMGSRAILIVCRRKDVARERFGILEDEEGVCYTRTGRRFFEALVPERELLATVQGALERNGFWDQFKTNWVCASTGS